MRRDIIRARPGHEENFRKTWQLRSDLQGDPYWEMAYEYAATHKLYVDEINALGGALVRIAGEKP